MTVRKKDNKKNRSSQEYDGSKPLARSKREMFVLAYLEDFDAKKAAMRAGYAAVNSFRTGYWLLKQPEIAARVEFLRSELAEKLMLTPERIAREYMKIAFSDLTEIIDLKDGVVKIRDFKEIPVDAHGALSEIVQTETSQGTRTTRVKLHSKTKALADLVRIIGMAEDGLESGAPVDNSFNVYFVPSKKEDKKIEKRIEGMLPKNKN